MYPDVQQRHLDLYGACRSRHKVVVLP
jgi:hypothetical protein